MSDDDDLKNGNRSTGSLSSVVLAVYFATVVSICWMQPFFSFAGHAIAPSDILFPPLALLWVLALLTRRATFRWHNVFYFLAIYFATLILSTVFSADQRTSLIKLVGEAYLIGLAVIGYSLLERELDFKRAVIAWLAGASVAIAIGLLAIVMYYVVPDNPLLGYITYHYGAVPVGNYPRISSVFVSASMFCNYLNVTAVMLLVANRKKWIGQTVFICGMAATALCSAFTISIGLGGIMLAAGIWIWKFHDRSAEFIRILAISFAVTLAAAFLIPAVAALQPYEKPPFVLRIPGTSKMIYPSPRLLVWSDTIGTISENFWTGKGLGLPTSAVVFKNAEGTNSLLADAHNSFLSVAAENGVISALAFLAFCLYLLRKTLANSDELVIALSIAFVTAFIYQGMTGAFQDARHLWVLIGMLLAALKLSGSPEQGLTHSTGIGPT